MSDDQLEFCGRCRQYPENILMLSCSHDLCLDCAAQVFDSPENSQAREKSGIQCPQCRQVTQLDQSSIYELEKILIEMKINKETSQSPFYEEEEDNRYMKYQ